MTDVDDIDFICHVAFDKKPLTRRERAENVKKRDFLSKYSGAARDVLEALLDKYMNTGIYENSLIHFETLIGIPILCDVIRGLIGVLRGDDQRMYFKMICFDMRQIEQNNLKKEAAKRPKKIQRYSMMMLICSMIIYLVVLCTEVLASLGAFFG